MFKNTAICAICSLILLSCTNNIQTQSPSPSPSTSIVAEPPKSIPTVGTGDEGNFPISSMKVLFDAQAAQFDNIATYKVTGKDPLQSILYKIGANAQDNYRFDLNLTAKQGKKFSDPGFKIEDLYFATVSVVKGATPWQMKGADAYDLSNVKQLSITGGKVSGQITYKFIKGASYPPNTSDLVVDVTFTDLPLGSVGQ
jgi:hypothetical protein